MNAVTKVQPTAQALAISEDEAIRVLGNSLYPGARPESIRMVLSWCKATGRDPMKKPIHIVPMYVKDANTGQGGMRDVLMPGIGTYRTDAAASGAYAGKGEPEFGPDVTGPVGNTSMTYPKWCKVTVERIVAGQVRKFTALEFWLENYATTGRDKDEPNQMWRKRPYAQLAKCAEAQALRMAFPDETGNTNTQEEMEGKAFDGVTIDAAPAPHTEAYAAPRQPTPAQPERKRTVREIVRDKLVGCTTEDEVHAVAALPIVTRALAEAPSDVREEIGALLADALTRVLADPDAAHEPVTEDVVDA